jgi:hypothetical protein
VSKPPAGCADELKAYEKAKAAKKSKRWLSKERKAADKKMDAAKERYKACVKARDDVMVLMLIKATLRVRHDLGMKVPMDWKKVPIENLNKYEEKTYARLWKKSSLAACVDVINKENKKLGIQRQVAHAVASLAADRIADRWELAGKITLWILIAAGVAAIAIFAAPAAAGAGTATAGTGVTSASTGVVTTGASTAGTGATGLIGKEAIKQGGKAVAKSAAKSAVQSQVKDPSLTMKAIKGITDAGGSAAGGRLRDAAKAAEDDYQTVKQDKQTEIKAIKADREAALKRGLPAPPDPLALPEPSGEGEWYKDPKVLTGIGVGVGLIAIAAFAFRKKS